MFKVELSQLAVDLRCSRGITAVKPSHCPHGCVLFHQVYGRVYRVVEPKRAQLNTAMAQLEEKQTALAEAQNKLREVWSSVQLTISLAQTHVTRSVHSFNIMLSRWRSSWTS